MLAILSSDGNRETPLRPGVPSGLNSASPPSGLSSWVACPFLDHGTFESCSPHYLAKVVEEWPTIRGAGANLFYSAPLLTIYALARRFERYLETDGYSRFLVSATTAFKYARGWASHIPEGRFQAEASTPAKLPVRQLANWRREIHVGILVKGAPAGIRDRAILSGPGGSKVYRPRCRDLVRADNQRMFGLCARSDCRANAGNHQRQR